jgi:hypothetical protein
MAPSLGMRSRIVDATIGRTVTESYEIWLGPNRVAVREAGSALLALVEYLRGQGVGDEDIVRLGNDEVSWRGAVYRARVSQPAPVS